MNYLVIINLLVFAGIMVFLARFRRAAYSLSQQILAGLAAGVIFGFALQFAYIGNPDAISGTLEWTNVIGSSYVNLLRMIIMPLVLVMMIAAVVRMREVAALGKIGAVVIGILIGTTMIAALLGISMANIFGLTAEGLTEGARELARAETLIARQETVENLGLADMLIRFVPRNIFHDLTGARPTSIIAVVIFGILFGIAALLVSKEEPERADAITGFVDNTQAIIMKLVHMIMALTP
jgi:L-cystine uptake protein TcyP (sodium:dicarboxylate symporter family)